MQVQVKFHFPVSVLQQQGDLILTAAEHESHAAGLAERLEPGLVAEGRALWTKLFGPPDQTATPAAEAPPAGSSAAQRSATGTVGQFTTAQKDALKVYRPLARKARKSAKLAFPGHTVKLHDEFGVTSDPPVRIDQIISDARLLLAAVRNPANAAILKSKAAYINKDANALEAATNALVGTETHQEEAKAEALGATDARNTNLNRLYDILLLIQNAARNEWDDRETQTAFRLEQFPPDKKAKASEPATKSSANPNT